jgi:hypothetical protein
VDVSKSIDYLWFEIPGKDGAEAVKGFITLDYTVEGASFVDREFTLKEGTPNRFPMKADGTGYAQRLGKVETEERRKAAFVATMQKKAADKLKTPEQLAAEAAEAEAAKAAEEAAAAETQPVQ